MKHIIFATALGLSIALCPQTWAGGSEFKPLPEAPKSGGEEFFKATDGEAKIEGHVVKLFVVKPDYLTASYKNESKKALSPEYTVRTYNRYGYLLSSAKVQVSMFGGSPRLEIGDVGGQKVQLNLVDITSVFRHTKLSLPADFGDVAWVSLAQSNTRLAEQAGADQPATAPRLKSEGNDKPKPELEVRPQ
jgi:hypothetical protein